MIEKIEVRRMLAAYESKIKDEISNINNEIKRMNEACETVEMMEIWLQSKRRVELSMKLTTLFEVLGDIIDMRCCEQLED